MKFSHFILDNEHAYSKGVSKLVAIYYKDKGKVFDENGNMRHDVVHTRALSVDIPADQATTIWKHIKFFKECIKVAEQQEEKQDDR